MVILEEMGSRISNADSNVMIMKILWHGCHLFHSLCCCDERTSEGGATNRVRERGRKGGSAFEKISVTKYIVTDWLLRQGV